MAPTKRILIVVTNAGEFEKVGFRTGLWLGELVEFWDVAEKAGYQINIASPSGGMTPLDPESLMLTQLSDAVGLKSSVFKRYKDRAFMDLLDRTLNVSAIDVAEYDAIYLTGGHGVMFDFPTSTALAELTAAFYESGKVVSAVCHGPCGLLDARLSTGAYLVNNRNVTGFSWNEEIAAKRADAVPFSLEEELRKRGGRYSKALIPFKAHVTEDDRLITGQNPASPKAVGEAVVRKLAEIA